MSAIGWLRGGWGVGLDGYPEDGVMGPYETWAEAATQASTRLPGEDTTLLWLTPGQCRHLEQMETE